MALDPARSPSPRSPAAGMFLAAGSVLAILAGLAGLVVPRTDAAIWPLIGSLSSLGLGSLGLWISWRRQRGDAGRRT